MTSLILYEYPISSMYTYVGLSRAHFAEEEPFPDGDVIGFHRQLAEEHTNQLWDRGSDRAKGFSEARCVLSQGNCNYLQLIVNCDIRRLTEYNK